MNRRDQIVEYLEKNRNDINHYFRSLTPGQLSMIVYADGSRWTAKQVAAHFVTIEQSMQWLFNNILSGGDGSPVDFDPDRFNRKQVPKLEGLSLDELLDRFNAVREETITIVRKLSDADLDRRGHHAFHGQGTLERFIRWAYEHANMHLEDIQEAVKGAGGP